MLHLYTADSITQLVDPLAEVLSQPTTDPFEPAWVAVPSIGLGRWLSLQLARRLGTSEGDSDGVAANLDLRFPGALRTAVLEAGTDTDPDPWSLPCLVWTVLDVLSASRGDRRLGPVATLPEGASAFSQARRVADLLDRYLTHRPAMMQAWAAGRGVDGAGTGLTPSAAWQHRVFRLVRERIAVPSPAERLPAILERLRGGERLPDLPGVLSLFGLTSIPGGAAFLELVSAVAHAHDVHLFIAQPSSELSRTLRASYRPEPLVRSGPLLRTGDGPLAPSTHPLLRSWARPSREATILWADLAARSPHAHIADLDTGFAPGTGSAPEARSLLERVQTDLRANRPPRGDHVLAPDDRSIEVHTCHGETRQVEVLRDVILHHLADDPSLTEDDILVVCPDITTYAPLVEAVFGSPETASEPTDHQPHRQTYPQLAYHITDRSLLDTDALLSAFASLLDLLGSRFSASAVLDFISQQPVRDRYELDDEAYDQIQQWVHGACVKWGLDDEHRTRWGLPPGCEALSWRFALDRLLVGITSTDDGVALAAGGVLPFEVEGSGVTTAGRLADLLSRLRALTDLATQERTIDEWLTLLAEAAADLLSAPPSEPWQRERLASILAELAEQSTAGGEVSSTPLTLDDVRRALGERLAGTPRRSNFFRGGITVSSLTPLRGVPYRLVCILGLDDEAFGNNGTDGDDLVAATPHLGDLDVRADARQALLETILATGEQLVITCTGRNVVTNQPVPPTTVLVELREIVRNTVRPEDRGQVDQLLAIAHPRQPFDERNFVPGWLRPEPWGFDARLLTAALARREKVAPRPFLTTPFDLDDDSHVELADLHRVLNHPVKTFLTDTLNIVLPSQDEQTSEDLLTSLSSLDRWKVADRLLACEKAGRDRELWLRREQAAGTLPPAGLGQKVVDELTEGVDRLMALATTCGYQPGAEPQQVPIDLVLADGTHLTGRVDDAGGDRPGPVRISCSRRRPTQLLAAWLDLMVLTAQDPGRNWRSITIAPPENSSSAKKAVADILEPVGDRDEERRRLALDALAVAVDCYRRARREPIPLFPKLSYPLAEGQASERLWSDRWGDGCDPAHQLAFGDVDLMGILALELRPHDPPGRATNRAERFAEYLWGTVVETCTVSQRDDRTRKAAR